MHSASAEQAKCRKFQGHRVRYGSDGESTGVLFNHEQACHGGVVVLHEWWGLNNFAQNASSRIAEAGLCVLAADVFRGQVFTKHVNAKENMMKLDFSEAAKEVGAAASHLRVVGCTRIAVTGFGFGGTLSLVAAALFPDLFLAVAPFCGVPRPTVVDVSKIKAKVEGHYALDDKVVGVAAISDVKALEERLAQGGVRHEIIWYKAKHAFCVPDYETYDATASETLFSNLRAFFKRELTDQRE
ncbi:hypothetical protein CAPTEDRAFT_122810 [Capitella teleta]|uniref:Dienelactone hydrolase domain-containing protein n=1 Tax=Capitella teleta TaxID=283909 RepID=R7UX34_CAPTE|nr:hypothetical protein CAPTEDRAFT_122810 [Capitella teleta]|eukprot:ELU11143.1 hypothetical protein CAPTEDRAFT_122810 [Capitella teleta]